MSYDELLAYELNQALNPSLLGYFAAAYILWAAYVWKLRGGKFGAIFRKLFLREPGTTVTRISCSLLMTAPLAVAFDPALAVLWLSIYVAMTLGYFDESMGLEQPGRDHFFLALWGVVVSAVATSPLLYFYGLDKLWYCLGGAAVVAAYAINKPLGRKWNLDWTERAELCTGAIIGSVALAMILTD
jgi:hypothetical protein